MKYKKKREKLAKRIESHNTGTKSNQYIAGSTTKPGSFKK